jgi:hypothetical protein
VGGIQTPWIIDAVCDTIKQYAQHMEVTIQGTTKGEDLTPDEKRQVSDLRAVIDALAFCIHDDC